MCGVIIRLLWPRRTRSKWSWASRRKWPSWRGGCTRTLARTRTYKSSWRRWARSRLDDEGNSPHYVESVLKSTVQSPHLNHPTQMHSRVTIIWTIMLKVLFPFKILSRRPYKVWTDRLQSCIGTSLKLSQNLSVDVTLLSLCRRNPTWRSVWRRAELSCWPFGETALTLWRTWKLRWTTWRAFARCAKSHDSQWVLKYDEGGGFLEGFLKPHCLWKHQRNGWNAAILRPTQY